MSIRHGVLAVAVCAFAGSALAALTLPPNITAEATGPQGAVVTYFAGADGSGDDENGRPIDKATCAPASGSTFPLGETTVNCTGSNGGTGSFKVKVVDTRGPRLNLPRDFSVPGSGQGATVTYSASAEDDVDGPVSVACGPPSGHFFPIGSTTVNCHANDSRNNNSEGSFVVTVIAQPPPPPPPLNDITVEATGPNGAVATFSAGGGPGDQDDENGRPMGTCSPASGSTFPLGETTVSCTNGNTFKVKVVDTTGPALSLPSNITTTDTTVTYTASASDLVDGSVGVTCAPPSGSTFANGTTTVNCSASDTRGNTSTGSFTVTVQDTPPPDDTEPPTFTSLSADPSVLWPPNGQLVTVNISATVIDNADATPFVGVYDVTCNEPITGDDWNVISPLQIELRASREGNGSGRVYTVHVEAIDASGNRSVSSVPVTVPHDQSGDASAPATAGPAKKWKGMRDSG